MTIVLTSVYHCRLHLYVFTACPENTWRTSSFLVCVFFTKIILDSDCSRTSCPNLILLFPPGLSLFVHVVYCTSWCVSLTNYNQNATTHSWSQSPRGCLILLQHDKGSSDCVSVLWSTLYVKFDPTSRKCVFSSWSENCSSWLTPSWPPTEHTTVILFVPTFLWSVLTPRRTQPTRTRDNIEFYVKKHLPPGDTQVQTLSVDSTTTQDVKLHNCVGCSIHYIKNDKYRGLTGKRTLKLSVDSWPEWTDTSETPSDDDELTNGNQSWPVVYYESRKWDLKVRLMNEGRCDETVLFLTLVYTGLVVELEHLKTNERHCLFIMNQ